MNTKEYYTIDMPYVVRTVWRRIWLIGICGFLAAVLGFYLATFAIAPTYASYTKLYVNNRDFSLGNTNFSISSSQLTAAQSLVRTYGEILDSRATLTRVAEKSGLDYDWREISRMITYEPSNDTEIMLVVVTCKNPYHASKIAETISKELPIRIAEIIDGASMEVVEPAFPQLQKPGALDVLEQFKSRGIPMAVASSTAYDQTVSHLDHAGLLGYFQVVVGGDMIEKGKPNPDIFLKAAELLRADPKDCIVVEDSPAGIRAAHASGMRPVLIPDVVPANAETIALSTAVLEEISQPPSVLEG